MRDKCPFCKVGRLVIDSVPPKMKHESQTDQFYEQVSRRRLQCNHWGASKNPHSLHSERIMLNKPIVSIK